MYAARKIKGEWWVGFLYSDGTFERIGRRPCNSEIDAKNAAIRMNAA